MAADIARRIGRVEGRLAVAIEARDQAYLEARLKAMTDDELEAAALDLSWMWAQGLDLDTERSNLPHHQRERLNAVESQWAAPLDRIDILTAVDKLL